MGAWYQGDLETNDRGEAHGHFVGRFSIETFAVAQGVAPAPLVFDEQPFPDTSENPAFSPFQMYHVGAWFNSGCWGRRAAPIRSRHSTANINAGIQVVNTAQFTDAQGALRQIHN